MIHQTNQLTQLFNLFFLSVFPATLKSSKVISILKKDFKRKLFNYCTASNIDKILERFIYNYLHEFLESNNFIGDEQFAFR